MYYNVKVYQVVLNEKKAERERALLFTRTMLGAIPTQEEFNKFYENVLSFKIDSEIKDMKDFCEFCFSELNVGNILTNEDINNLVIHQPYRSLSVGDILEINNKLYLVKMIGFGEFHPVESTDNEPTLILANNIF